MKKYFNSNFYVSKLAIKISSLRYTSQPWNKTAAILSSKRYFPHPQSNTTSAPIHKLKATIKVEYEIKYKSRYENTYNENTCAMRPGRPWYIPIPYTHSRVVLERTSSLDLTVVSLYDSRIFLIRICLMQCH